MGRSIAIDRGNAWTATSSDIEGVERRDDAGTPNLGAPDYYETAIENAPFVAGGDAMNWRADDSWWSLTLPFAFPFYRETFTQMHVSSDGFIHFAGPDSLNGNNMPETFTRNARIAPLWDDLTTQLAAKDIYVDQSVEGQITVRWEATNKADGCDVRFSATLFETGTIRFEYGLGNENLTPTVGISGGDGRNYHLASYVASPASTARRLSNFNCIRAQRTSEPMNFPAIVMT